MKIEVITHLSGDQLADAREFFLKTGCSPIYLYAPLFLSYFRLGHKGVKCSFSETSDPFSEVSENEHLTL